MNRDNLKDVKAYLDKIFNNNIKGGIFNLFYMSLNEMQDELNIKPNEVDIINNLKLVKKLIKENNLIPKNIKYIIGVEGLDYLKNIEDIDILYNLGVRSVNPVWNNHNKFGTGIRPVKVINNKKGLTQLGESLILKLIDKKIAIDLSHADEETFWDIIKICEKNRKSKPKILASHSNCKAICDVPRNLTNKQIIAIAKLNGIIGIVEVKSFCSNKNNINYEEEYIKHIIHTRELLGSVDNIVLSTDDMSYYKIEPEYYKNLNIFKHQEVSKKITELLRKNNFSNSEINKIQNKNYEKFFNIS